MAVRSERTERGLRGLRDELGLNVERTFGFWREEAPNSEDEKNEIDGDVAVVAIFTTEERLRVRGVQDCYPFRLARVKYVCFFFFLFFENKI